jgi:hypothetical protein
MTLMLRASASSWRMRNVVRIWGERGNLLRHNWGIIVVCYHRFIDYSRYRPYQHPCMLLYCSRLQYGILSVLNENRARFGMGRQKLTITHMHNPTD